MSVFEQRGRLAAAPDGASWDPGLEAYIWHGASEAATWQSGDTVFTVVTDGSEALLATAVDALAPRRQPPAIYDGPDQSGLGEDSGRCKGLGIGGAARSSDGGDAGARVR